MCAAPTLSRRSAGAQRGFGYAGGASQGTARRYPARGDPCRLGTGRYALLIFWIVLSKFSDIQTDIPSMIFKMMTKPSIPSYAIWRSWGESQNHLADREGRSSTVTPALKADSRR